MAIRDEKTKERLLVCAIRHFAEQGYAATNLAEIAKEEGVTRGPLYYYFTDKAALYRACVQRVIEENKEAYSRILVEGRPFLEMLREDFSYCLQDKGLFSRIGNGGKDEPDMTAACREFTHWLLQLKYRVFSYAKERGELPPSCDLSELITFIYIYYHGVIQVKQLAEEVDGFSRSMLDDSVDVFVDLIRKKFIEQSPQ